MKKFTVEVTQEVCVEIDETKFDEEFMQAFRSCFYDFEDIEDHACHLAQMEARGIIFTQNGEEFVEGYGPLKDMGIKLRVIDQWEDCRED